MGKSVITRETSLRLWPLGYVVVYGATSWGTLFAASVNPEVTETADTFFGAKHISHSRGFSF